MDLDRAPSFALGHHPAVLATRARSGALQQSPVLVGVDERGRFTVSSRQGASKSANPRRDPWAQLCVLSDGFFGDWVVVEGRAEVLPLPAAMNPLVEYHRKLSGEHENWDPFREGVRREQRVLIRVDALRAGPDRQG